jgi:hypothetical protein
MADTEATAENLRLDRGLLSDRDGRRCDPAARP